MPSKWRRDWPGNHGRTCNESSASRHRARRSICHHSFCPIALPACGYISQPVNLNRPRQSLQAGYMRPCAFFKYRNKVACTHVWNTWSTDTSAVQSSYGYRRPLALLNCEIMALGVCNIIPQQLFFNTTHSESRRLQCIFFTPRRLSCLHIQHRTWQLPCSRRTRGPKTMV